MAKQRKTHEQLAELYIQGLVEGKDPTLSRSKVAKPEKTHEQLAKERYDRDRKPVDDALGKMPKTQLEIIEE